MSVVDSGKNWVSATREDTGYDEPDKIEAIMGLDGGLSIEITGECSGYAHINLGAEDARHFLYALTRIIESGDDDEAP